MAGAAFLDLLVKHFDLEELRTLCFDLGINYHDLGGEGLTAKARELIAYCTRRKGMSGRLRDACARERPDVEWPVLEAADEAASQPSSTEPLEAKGYARPVMPRPEAKGDPRPVVSLPEAEHDTRPVVRLPNVAPTPVAPKPQPPTAPPRRVSPFVVGRPLRPDEPIFGRDAVFSAIRSEVERFSSVNIVGERRMGNSSIIAHVLGNPGRRPTAGEGEPPLLLARLDLQGNVTTPFRFYGRALRALLNAQTVDQHNQVSWIEVLRARLLEAPEASYDEFERVLRHLTTSGALRPVLVIDEFEQLLERSEDAALPFPATFYNGLRALLTANRLAMVVVSRRPLAEYFADPVRASALTSPFSTYFSSIKLEALERADADALLLQPSDYTLTLNQVNHAWAWAGGHPCHLQVAGQAWYEANRDGRDGAFARQRFEELKGQACFLANALQPLDHGVPPTAPRENPLVAALKAIFWHGPVRVGRVVQWFGGKVDSMVAWAIGMALILILVLVMLDVATGADLLALLKRLLGVE